VLKQEIHDVVRDLDEVIDSIKAENPSTDAS
jgi:hypothetical protein